MDQYDDANQWASYFAAPGRSLGDGDAAGDDTAANRGDGIGDGAGATQADAGAGETSLTPPPVVRRRRVLKVAAVVAVAAASAGAGLGVATAQSQRATITGSGVTALAATRPASTAPLTTSQVAAVVDPAVVDVNTVVELPSGSGTAAGTGMIVTSNGEILTNNHVVESATSIRVTVAGRGSYVAHVVGVDPTADVAVLKIDGVSGLPTVKFADSSSVTVGQAVVAIGNALGLGGTPTVTSGTITALGRAITASDATGATEHLTGMVQTDATIEPGNSGGPLVTTAGLVIGMNTAAASTSSTGQGSSVGFALPIDRVLSVANAIEAGKAGNGVVLGVPAFLGVVGQTVTLATGSGSSGVGVAYVEPGTPAFSAGLVAGDVIVAIDGKSTLTATALGTLIREYRPGSRVTVTYENPAGKSSVTAVLEAGPAA